MCLEFIFGVIAFQVCLSEHTKLGISFQPDTHLAQRDNDVAVGSIAPG